jgi:hypothetical protein
LPAGEAAIDNPPTVNALSHPSGDLGHTADRPRKTLSAPGPSGCVSHDNDSGVIGRQPRKRTHDDPQNRKQNPPTFGASSHLTGDLSHTGNRLPQTPLAPGPSDSTLNDNDSGLFGHQLRKRTHDSSQHRKKRARNSLQQPEPNRAPSGSN